MIHKMLLSLFLLGFVKYCTSVFTGMVALRNFGLLNFAASYARWADSHCYNAHYRYHQSTLTDSLFICKWICGVNVDTDSISSAAIVMRCIAKWGRRSFSINRQSISIRWRVKCRIMMNLSIHQICLYIVQYFIILQQLLLLVFHYIVNFIVTHQFADGSGAGSPSRAGNARAATAAPVLAIPPSTPTQVYRTHCPPMAAPQPAPPALAAPQHQCPARLRVLCLVRISLSVPMVLLSALSALSAMVYFKI